MSIQRAAFVGWAAALWLALAAQANVVSGKPFVTARVLFLAAMAISLLSSLGWPALPACKVPVPSSTQLTRIRLVALLSGAALMLVAVPLTAALAYSLAALAWTIGVATVVAACILPAHVEFRRPSTSTLVVLAITLGAFLLRVVDLAGLPPEVHGDEAAIGNEARGLLSGAIQNLFGLGWYEIDEVAFAVSAAFMRLFGNDLFGLRLPSTVQGALSVTITYLLVQHLFSMRTAIVTACLLSVAEMHLHYSRTGFIYIQACLVTVLLLYLLIRALDRRGILDYVLLGMVGGLSLLVYAAARLAPVLVVLYLGHALIRERSRFLRAHTPGFIVAAVAGLVFVAPMGVVYSKVPAAFNVRTGDISVLSGPGLQHELSAYRVSSLGEVLSIQAQKTLEGFVYSGETSQQFGHPAPLLDPWTGALFVAGVGAFAWRLREPAYFLLSTWLWLTLLLGSVFTVDAPFSPHLTGMLPLLGIFPALFVEAGWRSAERIKPRVARPVFAATTVALGALALVANVRDYVEEHAVRLQPAGFATSLGRYIVAVNDQYRVFLISRPDTSIKYETTRFLVPAADAVDLHDGPLDAARTPTDGKGMAFVVESALPTAPQRLDELRRTYPGGREEVHRTTRGDMLFISYVATQPKTNMAAPL